MINLPSHLPELLCRQGGVVAFYAVIPEIDEGMDVVDGDVKSETPDLFEKLGVNVFTDWTVFVD